MAQYRSWPVRTGPAVRAQSPFGRVASPDEVAAAVTWLATEGSGVDQRHRAGCQRRVLPALISDRPRQRSISLACMAEQLPVGSGAATRPGGRTRNTRQSAAIEEAMRDADGFRTAQQLFDVVRATARRSG